MYRTVNYKSSILVDEKRIIKWLAETAKTAFKTVLLYTTLICINKNSSEDEIANVNFLTTTSYM